MPTSRRLPATTAPQLNLTVTVYSESNLAEAFSNEWVSKEEIQRRQQFEFFRECLGEGDDALHAKTIVSEFPYVSQSYLQDYADYYSRGFAPYDRDCKRVHFFGEEFTKQELLAALTESDEHLIWKSYLGYVVVKPIPAPLGATLLRPYANGAQKERCYPVQRPYYVNLLGKRLTVVTLIWQQQDNNVSACATTALWMAFHKTAFLFQTSLPSPYRITESAGDALNPKGRSFPNLRGLDQFQIMKAIQSVGLVSEVRNQYIAPTDLNSAKVAAQQLREARAFIYAHLRMGLPVLLFIKFELEGHLIAATGYRKPLPIHNYSEEGGLALVSDGIERMYVHDDGIGPYSRLGFDDSTGMLATAWPHNGDWNEREMAMLMAVAVPITPDVRIQYEQIYEQAARFNVLLQFLRPVYAADNTPPAVWDIYLQYSNVHKSETLASNQGSLSQRQRVAQRLLPKYIWVARATHQGRPLLELLFDATDLHTGFYCSLTTTYQLLQQPLSVLLPTDTFQKQLQQVLDGRYISLLMDDLDLNIGSALQK